MFRLRSIRTEALLIASFLLCASELSNASANPLWTPNTSPARETGSKVFINFDKARERETLVEEVTVSVKVPRFAWIRAFPSRPEVDRVDLNFFSTLDGLTRIQPPYRESVQNSVFGPSAMTALLHAVSAPPPVAAGDESTPRMHLADRGVHFFEGPSTTSTVTHRRYLPQALEMWIANNQLAPTEADRGTVGHYLDLGWTIVAVIIEGSGTDPLILGPTAYHFKTPAPIHPVLLSASAALPDGWTYYFGGETAMELGSYSTTWDERPWDPDQNRPADQLVVSYAHGIDLAMAGDLERLLGGTELRFSMLTRGRLSSPIPLGRDASIVPAKSPVMLPSSSGRGSTVDIFLCILLGITPLLYTPESWLLFYLGIRAREQRRKDPEELALGSWLWPLYALVVAGFWAVKLEGIGRVAALVPLFVGILQLATPPPDRERGPIRVDFARRRKKPGEPKAKTSLPAKNSIPAAGTKPPPTNP